MDHPRKSLKTKLDDRIILHFDLDCFYAQVYENKTPSLKSLPLGIRQKSLLATCNYPARRLGVKKLMSISSALAICPDLVIVDGEDLTPFRDVSKRLYSLLRSYPWNDKVERLGLDEVWMDVTDLIEYNVKLLNRNDLECSWFCLDREDPERGFGFDARGFEGSVYGDDHDHFGVKGGNDAEVGLLRTKLLIASHLAFHLRMKIEEEGYTTACGISTNKLLAKLVGNVNKPRNQTTLLSFGPEGEKTVRRFMGSHQLRKVPGIGGKTASILSDYFISHNSNSNPSSSPLNPKSITVADILSLKPPLTSSSLSTLLSSGTSTTVTTSSARDLLSLLHGHDLGLVKPARLLPTQISIEDTYHFCPLTSVNQIHSELVKITGSLLKRMKTDLLIIDENNKNKTKWMAKPKTLRLTTRPRVDPKEGRGYGYLRVSKSGALPGYVFGIAAPRNTSAGGDDGGNTAVMGQVAERLVTETLLPMFHQLNSQTKSASRRDEKIKGKGDGYSIGLLNVCVTNMDNIINPASGGGGGGGGGRDIKDMFMRQREFTVYDRPDDDDGGNHGNENGQGGTTAPTATITDQPGFEETADDMDVDGNWEGNNGTTCTSPKGTQDSDNDNHANYYQDLSPDSYQQNFTLPNSTNDYFHIDDDDEIWDDEIEASHNEEGNTCNNHEESGEDLDYTRDPSGLTGMSGDGGDDGDGVKCPLCNHFIPLFALAAHERFHNLEGDGD